VLQDELRTTERLRDAAEVRFAEAANEREALRVQVARLQRGGAGSEAGIPFEKSGADPCITQLSTTTQPALWTCRALQPRWTILGALAMVLLLARR